MNRFVKRQRLCRSTKREQLVPTPHVLLSRFVMPIRFDRAPVALPRRAPIPAQLINSAAKVLSCGIRWIPLKLDVQRLFRWIEITSENRFGHAVQ